ncbi:hypothetical protein MUO65_03725 [bacterium]|nr:hypothetical protein [bacterium]
MDTKKLNWSTTASYYSIVHSSRMIVFTAVGDFPTQHNALSGLFAGNKRPCKLNWLRRFASDYTHHPNDNGATFSRQELCNHYREALKLEHAEDLIRHVGVFLNKAKELRNDSNYEALLMAHEYMHVSVSDSFRRLSQTMADAAKFCLEAATKCFKHYLEFDTSLDNMRDAFKYFVSRHIRDRIYEPVQHRCGNQYVKRIKECIGELEDICHRPTQDTKKGYASLEKSISMKVFGQKTSLMQGFNSRVNALEKDVSSIL